ncbi:peptidylprolyl isomerase [Cerasicoccus fimbriatus]|uniref:peptidylprolyl isomerase n=1 Tax=Cerasicoccus fimbriatus TaxID=3014554 RepID=UPI0022B43E65|nr:peptidylprolyl isomerase [Cerasicoccus sp. TK19100]
MFHYKRPLILSILTLAALPTGALHAAKVLPVLNDYFQTYPLYASNPNATIDLNELFSTEEIADQAVRFTSIFSIGENPLVIDMALFNSTPESRDNFLTYVNSGAYDNQIIHRRPTSDFVAQGGGFVYNSTDVRIDSVTTNDPVVNEFGISNTRWTVAMAKVGGDPDSATSQWFININQNSANLDFQNGGFTVFARVLQSAQDDTSALTSTANFPVYDVRNILGSPFGEMPLINYDGENLTPNNLNLLTTATLVDVAPADAGESTDLTFTLDSNSDPDAIQASINGSEELILSAPADQFGDSTITITATDSVGNEVTHQFVVVVENDFAYWRVQNFSGPDATNDNISGPYADPNNDGYTNLEDYSVSAIVQGNRGPQSIDTFQLNETDGAPTFTFEFRNDLGDLTYDFQYSPDLGVTPWTTIPYSVTNRITDGVLDTITIKLDDSGVTDSSNAFYRRVLNHTPNPVPSTP